LGSCFKLIEKPKFYRGFPETLETPLPMPVGDNLNVLYYKYLQV